MATTRLYAALVLATIPVGCDSSGSCEEGTVQVGGTCYAHDPSDVAPPIVSVSPPVRTRAVGDVTLTSDEHATIYYTIDGTPPTKLSLNEDDQVLLQGLSDNAVVSFFAVDVNGNTSPVQTVTWQIDRNGPGAPEPFALTLAGDTRTVTWTPPKDPQLGGVLVARVEGVRNVSPEPGVRYVPGNAIGPGVTVVAAVAPGFNGSFTETRTAAPGMVRYVAWSYDDLLNYGPPAGDVAQTTLPAQTATVTVDAGTGAVTVGTQPANLVVAGTATLNGSDLTVSLSVTNATSRALFAPKALLTNTLSTQSFDNSDGTFMTFPYRSFGAAIPPGGTVSRTFEIGNVTNTDVLSLSLDFRDNPVIVAPAWTNSTSGSVVDEETGSIVQILGASGRGFQGEVAPRGGGVTADGRVVFGSRVSGYLTTIDLATGTAFMRNLLSEGKSSIPRVIVDSSGSAGYALLAHSHAYGLRFDGSPTELVTFDVGSLRVTGRVDIGPSRNRDLWRSPDGHWLAVATSVPTAGVVLVDLHTMRVVRSFVPEDNVGTVAFTADSASLLTASADRVAIYSVADGTLTKSIPVQGAGKTFHGEVGPDGRFWFSAYDAVLAVNLDTGASESFAFGATSLEIFNGKIYVSNEGDSDVARLDLTGVSDKSFGFSEIIYGHWAGHSPF